MYNRYIPQPDGTYRRSSQPDRTGQTTHRQSAPIGNTQQPKHQPEQEKKPDPGVNYHRQNLNRRKKTCSPPVPPKQETCRDHQRPDDGSALSFLRRLLPREFDTGDLLIVLLILLMAGDCREEQNTALLTLVLYLFL